MSRPFADDGIMRRIIEAAGAAPSIHNTQPWRFVTSGHDLLELHGDPDRELWVADPKSRALHLSCGAALFNIRMAIRMRSYNPLVWPLPQLADRPTLLALIQAEPGRPAALNEREMYDAIWRRHTNRGPFSDQPVPLPVRAALEQAAGFEFATLRLMNSSEAATVLELAEQADHELAADFDHQVEMQRWIASGSDKDGIQRDALPPEPDRHPAPVRDLGSAAPTVARPVRSYEQSPQLAVLTTARDGPADWLRAGQALQRVLLAATAYGLSASFLYQPIELRDMRGPASPGWPWPETPHIIIRFGYAPTAPESPRRPLEDVLQRTPMPGSPA
jgi:nitroreductase